MSHFVSSKISELFSTVSALPLATEPITLSARQREWLTNSMLVWSGTDLPRLLHDRAEAYRDDAAFDAEQEYKAIIDFHLVRLAPQLKTFSPLRQRRDAARQELWSVVRLGGRNPPTKPVSATQEASQ